MTYPETGTVSPTIGPQEGAPAAMKITRTYRIDRDVWEGATAKAAGLGVALSTVVDRFLRAWLQGLIPLPTERVELTIDDDTDERDGPT